MKIPLLVLGAGSVVSEFYLPTLAGLGLIDGTTVIDRAPEQLSEVAKKWPAVQIRAGDFRNFLREDIGTAPRAAIVALPNALHVEACLLAIAAGYDVLCDKPLALHTRECKSIFAASSRAGRIVDVNMCRRYLPSMMAIRRSLQGDLIGRLVSIDVEDGEPYSWSAATTAPFHRENGGVLADMGVHYLDLLEHLVGRLKPRAYRNDCRGGVEANAVIELETETCIPVRIALSRTRELRNSLVLQGSRGRLTAHKNEFDGCLWSSDAGLKARLTPDQPFVANWPPTLLSCFAQKISDFLKCMQERSAPGTSALDAASTIAIIEWAYDQRRGHISENAASKRTIVRRQLPPGRAVVTGGTGFIGSHLIGRLVELGFEQISVPIRRIETCAEAARYPVSLEPVNLLDAKQVRDAIQGARWIFHLAFGRDGDKSERVTIEGTRNVVEAAIAAGSECVVVLSTVYVFGDADGVVDETHPYRPKGGRYGSQKAEMERWCLARSATSSPTRIVILNPSCVFGPRGETYTELPHRLAKAGAFCWIEGGRGIANICFIDNLVDAILLAARNLEAHGQRFIINDGTATWRDFLAPLVGDNPDRWPSFNGSELAELNRARRPKWRDALHSVSANRYVRDVLKTRMPTSAMIAFARRACPTFFDRLRSAARVPQLVTPALKPQDAVPPSWLADLFGPSSTRFSSARAGAVLGWRPAVEFAEAMDITLRWLHGDNASTADGSGIGKISRVAGLCTNENPSIGAFDSRDIMDRSA